MLFNSIEFIFGFLPITIAVFYLVRRIGGARVALAWLTAASPFFTPRGTQSTCCCY